MVTGKVSLHAPVSRRIPVDNKIYFVLAAHTRIWQRSNCCRATRSQRAGAGRRRALHVPKTAGSVLPSLASCLPAWVPESAWGGGVRDVCRRVHMGEGGECATLQGAAESVGYRCNQA